MNANAERLSLLRVLLDRQPHTAKELRAISLEFRSRNSEWRKKGYDIRCIGKNPSTRLSEHQLFAGPGELPLEYEEGTE